MFQSDKDANVFLGELDFLLMISYGVGLFFSGMIGDRINKRYVLTVGIIGSAFTTYVSCSLSVHFDIQSKLFYRSLFFINGLFQSLGWPCLVAVMGNWFSKASAGLVFGIWGVHAFLGNVIGSLVVTSVLEYGYENGIMLVSLISTCVGGLVFVGLISNPTDIGLPCPDDMERSTWLERTASTVSIGTSQQPSSRSGSRHNTSSGLYQNNSIHLSGKKSRSGTLDPISDSKKFSSSNDHETTPLLSNEHNDAERKPISLLAACRIPGVMPYASGFACFKLVTYAFFFWLPTYLSQGLQWPDEISNKISNCFEVGLVVGSIVSGVVSDLMGLRSPVVGSMLIMSAVSVYLYKAVGVTYVSNVILMLCTGFFIGGPENLFTSVISADLGKHDNVAKGTSALATVSGIINGSGSLGAAFGQFAVGYISKVGGWVWVFHFLLIMVCVSFVLVSPMLIKELKSCCCKANYIPVSHDDSFTVSIE